MAVSKIFLPIFTNNLVYSIVILVASFMFYTIGFDSSFYIFLFFYSLNLSFISLTLTVHYRAEKERKLTPP